MTINDLEARIKKSKVEQSRGLHIFSNMRRRAIYRTLTKLPCQTESSIAKHNTIDVKVARWHLWKLAQAGYVAVQELDKRYYYVPELVDIGDLRFFSELNSKEARKLILFVRDGCRALKEIKVPKSTLYRYIKIFESMGYIRKVRNQSSYVCPSEPLFELGEKSEEKGMNFKREFMKKIEAPGFHVRVLGELNHELKLEVYGLERFTMGVYISPLETALEV